MAQKCLKMQQYLTILGGNMVHFLPEMAASATKNGANKYLWENLCGCLQHEEARKSSYHGRYKFGFWKGRKKSKVLHKNGIELSTLASDWDSLYELEDSWPYGP